MKQARPSSKHDYYPINRRSIASMKAWLIHFFPTCKAEVEACKNTQLLRETVAAVIE